MKHYYRKAIPLSKVATRNGTVIPFQAISDSWGFIEYDDSDTEGAYFISEIDRLIRNKVGGIEEVDETRFKTDFTEKKSYLIPLLPTHLGGTREGREYANPGSQILQDTSGVRVKPAEVEAARNQPTAPIEPVPTVPANAVTSSKPTVGKIPNAALAV